MLNKEHSPFSMDLEEITYNQVKQFLSLNNFPFTAGQRKVSFPVIQRIHRRYQEGHRFAHIKIREGVTICDGHHRFISLSLAGGEIETVPAGENVTKQPHFEWCNVELDHDDFDTKVEKKLYEERYDGCNQS